MCVMHAACTQAFHLGKRHHIQYRESGSEKIESASSHAERILFRALITLPTPFKAESRKPAGGRKMTSSPLGFSRSPWRPSPSSQRCARWASKTLGNNNKAASRTSPAIRRRQAPTNRLLGSMKPLWETTRSFLAPVAQSNKRETWPYNSAENATRLLEGRSRASKEKVLNALLWGYGAYASSLREQQKGREEIMKNKAHFQNSFQWIPSTNTNASIETSRTGGGGLLCSAFQHSQTQKKRLVPMAETEAEAVETTFLLALSCQQ